MNFDSEETPPESAAMDQQDQRSYDIGIDGGYYKAWHRLNGRLHLDSPLPINNHPVHRRKLGRQIWPE